MKEVIIAGYTAKIAQNLYTRLRLAHRFCVWSSLILSVLAYKYSRSVILSNDILFDREKIVPLFLNTFSILP